MAFFIFPVFCIANLKANSVEPDQTQLSAASALGLQCLQISLNRIYY